MDTDEQKRSCYCKERSKVPGTAIKRMTSTRRAKQNRKQGVWMASFKIAVVAGTGAECMFDARREDVGQSGYNGYTVPKLKGSLCVYV